VVRRELHLRGEQVTELEGAETAARARDRPRPTSRMPPSQSTRDGRYKSYHLGSQDAFDPMRPARFERAYRACVVRGGAQLMTWFPERIERVCRQPPERCRDLAWLRRGLSTVSGRGWCPRMRRHSSSRPAALRRLGLARRRSASRRFRGRVRRRSAGSKNHRYPLASRPLERFVEAVVRSAGSPNTRRRDCSRRVPTARIGTP
jgi:hypothetical protein